jgi:hypothetical protein
MDKRLHVRIGLAGLVAVGLAFGASPPGPSGVGMGMRCTTFMG